MIVSLLMLIGWVAAIVAGIVLILQGKDKHNRPMVLTGSLLIAAITIYCIYIFLFW